MREGTPWSREARRGSAPPPRVRCTPPARTSRSPTSTPTAVSELADELGASFVAADVTDAEQVATAVAHAAGQDGLRISVCCAGIGPAQKIAGSKGPHSFELFENVIRVNLIGTFNVLRLAADRDARQRPRRRGERGVCVNTASIAAYDGQIGQVAYAASKGGIVGLTLPAARDLSQNGIRVCTIAPGLFDTPLMAGLPEEVREALGKSVPHPGPARPPGRVRRAGAAHRLQPDAQRRDHPPGWRPAYGS